MAFPVLSLSPPRCITLSLSYAELYNAVQNQQQLTRVHKPWHVHGKQGAGPGPGSGSGLLRASLARLTSDTIRLRCPFTHRAARVRACANWITQRLGPTFFSFISYVDVSSLFGWAGPHSHVPSTNKKEPAGVRHLGPLHCPPRCLTGQIMKTMLEIRELNETYG